MRITDLPDFDSINGWAYGGAIRLLHDPATISEHLRAYYGVQAPDQTFFLTDGFGTLFGVKDGGEVIEFISDTAEVIAHHVFLDEFYSAIAQDPDETMLKDIYDECCMMHGVPGPGECFAAHSEHSEWGQSDPELYRILPIEQFLSGQARVALQPAQFAGHSLPLDMLEATGAGII